MQPMGLHEYKAWRASLVPLRVNTVLEWIHTEPYHGLTKAYDIHSGHCYLVKKIQEPIGSRYDGTDASKVYVLVKCSRKGKESKKAAILDC